VGEQIINIAKSGIINNLSNSTLDHPRYCKEIKCSDKDFIRLFSGNASDGISAEYRFIERFYRRPGR